MNDRGLRAGLLGVMLTLLGCGCTRLEISKRQEARGCFQKAAERCYDQFFESSGPRYPRKNQIWSPGSLQTCLDHPIHFLFYKKRAGEHVKNLPSDRDLPLLFSDAPCVDNERIVFYYAGGFAWMSEPRFRELNLQADLIGR